MRNIKGILCRIQKALTSKQALLSIVRYLILISTLVLTFSNRFLNKMIIFFIGNLLSREHTVKKLHINVIVIEYIYKCMHYKDTCSSSS